MTRPTVAALTYPVAGEAAERPLVASWVLVLLAGLVPVLPLVPLLGYWIAVLEAGRREESAPPFLRDAWLHVRRGAVGLVLAVLVLGGPALALLVTVYGAGARTDASLEGYGAVVFYAGSTTVLFATLTAAYLLPLVLARYAVEGSVRRALSPGALRARATRGRYFAGWTRAAVLGTVGAAVAVALGALGRVGLVVAALVIAYAGTLASHQLGRALRVEGRA